MKLLLTVALLAPAVFPSAPEIAWRESFPDTMSAAAEQKQVVLLAVNMDGERANDRMAKEVYSDSTIVELSQRVLPLVASVHAHSSEGKVCARFGTVTCAQHQKVDIAARSEVLKPDEEGFVVAPQHVLLGPDGKVILSVPYEISAEELEWCIVTALLTVDPESDVRLSRKARAPQRLILGDVLAGAVASEIAPVTREEALELITRLKKGTLSWADRERAVRRLSTADEKEAREYILSLLRSNLGGGRGAGGGPGGGGAGGGGRGGGGDGEDRRILLLRWIGFASPASYWEVCNEFLGSGERAMQLEAIVAFEQLAAKEALPALQAQLRREKDPIVVKKLLRAIGTSGRDDRNARTTLIKQAGQERTPVLAVNALLGLGSLTAHADIQTVLREALTGEPVPQRIAAALAMAFTRDAEWLGVLREQLATEPPAELVTALNAAIAVLEGGPLSGLRDVVSKVAEDTLPRPRIFGIAFERP